MNWINDLRLKARDKWIEWNNIPPTSPDFIDREENLALYNGMIRMGDRILSRRLYELKDLEQLRNSKEFKEYFVERVGVWTIFHLNECGVFLDFLKAREKKLPRVKPLILVEEKPVKKVVVKKEVS